MVLSGGCLGVSGLSSAPHLLHGRRHRGRGRAVASVVLPAWISDEHEASSSSSVPNWF